MACSWNSGTPSVFPRTFSNSGFGNTTGFFAFTPAQIRMDHVALDRTGPDDGDLDDEIIECPGLHPGQHRHLGAALDLKGAERVGLPDHGVGARVLGRNGRKIQFNALGFGEEIEGALHAGQHAEGRESTFMNFRLSMSSLSHSMTCRSGIAAGSIGTSSSSLSSSARSRRMLREMPRGADQFARERDCELEPSVIELRLSSSACLGSTFLRPAPDLGGQQLDHVFGQSQRLADVAQRALGAVADHRRAQRCMVAAVGLETHCMTISRRSCSKSTSMSGGSRRSSETKRSNRRSLRSGSIEVMPST